jgi:hypothetical protein
MVLDRFLERTRKKKKKHNMEGWVKGIDLFSSVNYEGAEEIK